MTFIQCFHIQFDLRQQLRDNLNTHEINQPQRTCFPGLTSLRFPSREFPNLFYLHRKMLPATFSSCSVHQPGLSPDHLENEKQYRHESLFLFIERTWWLSNTPPSAFNSLWCDCQFLPPIRFLVPLARLFVLVIFQSPRFAQGLALSDCSVNTCFFLTTPTGVPASSPLSVPQTCSSLALYLLTCAHRALSSRRNSSLTFFRKTEPLHPIVTTPVLWCLSPFISCCIIVFINGYHQAIWHFCEMRKRCPLWAGAP